MRKWHIFLTMGAGLFLISALFDAMRSFYGYTVPLVITGISVFILGWLGMFLAIKYLKTNKVNSEKKFLLGCYMLFVWGWSVSEIFQLMEYLLENNVLNKYYFFGIGFLLMLLGIFLVYLTKIIPSKEFKKKKFKMS